MPDCTCADPNQLANTIKEQAKTTRGANENNIRFLDQTLYGRRLTADVSAGDVSAASVGSSKPEHGAFSNLRFCHWTPPEYGSTGESLWTNLWQAAQLAISIALATIQGQISDKNQDLAEGYYQMAKNKWDRFRNKYMPLEKDLLYEVSSVPEPQMDCDDDRERAENAVNLSYDLMDKYLAQRARLYRICLDNTSTRQMNLGRSLTLVDTENYNLQDDRWFTDYKSDQRWSRRSDVLNLGRNMGSIAQEYGKVARALGQDVGAITDKVAGSLSMAIGYYGSRFDTAYPTTYLSTGGMANGIFASTNGRASNAASGGF